MIVVILINNSLLFLLIVAIVFLFRDLCLGNYFPRFCIFTTSFNHHLGRQPDIIPISTCFSVSFRRSDKGPINIPDGFQQFKSFIKNILTFGLSFAVSRGRNQNNGSKQQGLVGAA
jgi:hypothetical protein